MNVWGQAAATVQALLDQYGVLAIALLVLVEEAGVPIPIPGDAVMLLAGIRAHSGQGNLLLVVASLELATVLGSSFLYAFARRAGRATVYRYGGLLHLTPQRLDRAEAWLQRRGPLAVTLGRLIPGLRILTSIACGVFGVRYRVFLPSMALGGLVYILAYVLTGYFAGPPMLALLDQVHLPLDAMGSLLLLVVLLVWLVRARRALLAEPAGRGVVVETGQRVRSGAGAGAIAALCAALGFNFLAQLASSLVPLSSDAVVREVAARLPPEVAAHAFLAIVLDLVVFVLVGVGWGTLYAVTVERYLRPLHLPDAVGGACFALLPLAATLLFESSGLGLGNVIGLPAAIGFLSAQGLRYLVYGALLGVTCPIFLATPPGRSAVNDEVARS